MIFLLLTLNWFILILVLISTIPNFIVQNRYGYRNYWMLRERSPELRKQNYFGMILTSSWFIKEIRIFHLEDYFTIYRSLFGKFYNENRKFVLSGIQVAFWHQ